MLINGCPDRMIMMSKRELREGDPLSPLVFVLAADAFTRMLAIAVHNNSLQ